jgi:hypothetical protein
MHWRQVCLVAQAFTASKQGATWTKYEPIFSIYAKPELVNDPPPPLDAARRFEDMNPRVQVFPKFKDFEVDRAWLVRRAGRRVGEHVYLEPVNTELALREALERAWDMPTSTGFCRGIKRTVEEDMSGGGVGRLMLRGR